MKRPALLARWLAYSAAFNARARRERVLLCAAAAAAAFMLGDALWLTPAQRAHRQASEQLRQQQAALATLDGDAARIAAMHQAQVQQARRELAQWRERVRQADATLREQTSTLVGPERMLPLLQELLAGHGGVKVRAAQTLPRVDLLAAAGGEASGGPTLYRHGLELTLEGSFADLLAGLRALEALPQRLLWGGLQFKVEEHPRAVLTLRVHTLSLEKTWLEI